MEQLIYSKSRDAYTFEVYKGLSPYEASYEFNEKLYEKTVKVKAFKIVIKLETYGAAIPLVYDLGYCTTRAGDFKAAIDYMVNHCKNLAEMKAVVADLKERTRGTFDRDATRILRKLHGLYHPKPTSVKNTTASPGV